MYDSQRASRACAVSDPYCRSSVDQHTSTHWSLEMQPSGSHRHLGSDWAAGEGRGKPEQTAETACASSDVVRRCHGAARPEACSRTGPSPSGTRRGPGEQRRGRRQRRQRRRKEGPDLQNKSRRGGGRTSAGWRPVASRGRCDISARLFVVKRLKKPGRWLAASLLLDPPVRPSEPDDPDWQRLGPAGPKRSRTLRPPPVFPHRNLAPCSSRAASPGHRPTTHDPRPTTTNFIARPSAEKAISETLTRRHHLRPTRAIPAECQIT